MLGKRTCHHRPKFIPAEHLPGYKKITLSLQVSSGRDLLGYVLTYSLRPRSVLRCAALRWIFCCCVLCWLDQAVLRCAGYFAVGWTRYVWVSSASQTDFMARWNVSLVKSEVSTSLPPFSPLDFKSWGYKGSAIWEENSTELCGPSSHPHDGRRNYTKIMHKLSELVHRA